MDANQLLIKIVLIVIFAIIALIILLPGRGARGQAIRRLALVLVMVGAIVAVIVPDATNEIARFLGVGRGTDLLLYGLIVVFIGFALSSSGHTRRIDRQVTDLARRQALSEAGSPEDSAPGRLTQGAV